MALPRDDQERRLLMAELKKCSHERVAAEGRIINHPNRKTTAELRALLDARDVARKNHEKAMVAAYRERLRRNP